MIQGDNYIMTNPLDKQDKLKELYARAPLDAHIIDKNNTTHPYQKYEDGRLWYLDSTGEWLENRTSRTLHQIEIPVRERELNRLADELEVWAEMPQTKLGLEDGEFLFRKSEWQERRAIRHPESNTPEKPDSSESIETYQYKIVEEANGLAPISGQTYLNFPALLIEDMNDLEEYALKLYRKRNFSEFPNSSEWTEDEIKVAEMHLPENQAPYSSWDEVPEDLKWIVENTSTWHFYEVEATFVTRHENDINIVKWCMKTTRKELDDDEYTRAQWQCAKDLQPKGEPQEVMRCKGQCNANPDMDCAFPDCINVEALLEENRKLREQLEPQPEAAEWVQGENPPIGAYCETRVRDVTADGDFNRWSDDWVKVTVIGEWQGSLILKFDENVEDDIAVIADGKEQFRPITKPQQARKIWTAKDIKPGMWICRESYPEDCDDISGLCSVTYKVGYLHFEGKKSRCLVSITDGLTVEFDFKASSTREADEVLAKALNSDTEGYRSLTNAQVMRRMAYLSPLTEGKDND